MMEIYEIAILTTGLIILVALIGALVYIFWKKKKKSEDNNLEEVLVHRPDTEHQYLPARYDEYNNIEKMALLIVLMALKGSLEYMLSQMMKKDTEDNNLEEVVVHQPETEHQDVTQQ